ncbi:MAG TPA: hypothetical protein VIQ11_06425 [Mycobacterium sp.]
MSTDAATGNQDSTDGTREPGHADVSDDDIDLDDLLAGLDHENRIRYELIGRIIGAGAQVDDGVRRLIMALEGTADLGKLRGFARVLSRAQSAVARQNGDPGSLLRRMLSDAEVRALNQLLGGLQDLMDERNNVGHGTLVEGGSDHVTYVMKLDSGGPTEMDLNPADERFLWDLYQELEAAGTELWRYDVWLSGLGRSTTKP